MVSCGSKNNQKMTEAEENLLLASHNEIRCENTSNVKLSPVLEGIIKASGQIPLVNQKYLQFKGISLNLSDEAFIPESGHTWDGPLFMSEKLFEKKWNTLLLKIKGEKNLLWKAIINGYEIKDEYFLSTDTEEVAKVIPELNYIASLAQRYSSYSCAKDELETRRPDDVRQFLSLESMSCKNNDTDNCLEVELKNFSRLDKTKKLKLERDLLALCERNEKSEICSSLWITSVMNNEAVKFYETYSKELKEKTYSDLFKLKKEYRKFKCEKDNETLVMNIPFYAKNGAYESYDQAYVEILSKTEKFWSNDQFKVHFFEAPKADGAVQVIKTQSIVSRVDESAPLFIELSSSLNGEIAAKTFAHEFGHVLGFPDCYLEFFERENNQVVYYELDHERKNLMCSLRFGSKIPNNYLEELSQKSCL